MSLLDLKTDLKSLKFGSPPASDRPGSGNSGQPYIKDPIDASVAPQSEDFLLRGGLNAPLDAANDVVRLTKFFGDLKSPRGILFVAKQNLLSRIAVNTQASGKGVNEGVYTPLTTLAQAGVGFAGGHLSKQGLNPLSGVKTYGPKSLFNPQGSTVIGDVIGEPDGEGNRLVDFYKKNILQSNESPTLYSYSGGPGSKLGIGETNIEFATDNRGAPLKTGIENNQLRNSGFFPITSTQLDPIGDLLQRNSLLLGSENQNFQPEGTPPSGKPTGFGIFKGKELKQDDFRTPYLKDQKSSTVISFAPSYNPAAGKTIDGVNGSRINYTSPGQQNKNLISYTRGSGIGPVDKINAQPIYKSKYVKQTDVAKNDLVKFRIGAVLRDGKKVFMHFRAFIDQFSDSYGAKWSGIQYMGRGEELYKYGGFSRKISLSYTVAAQSKPEIMEQYKKLNFLASTLAPDYGSSGYMGGVLTTLTLGGWCYELPGFIDSLSLDIPQESPWEIAIGSDVKEGKGDKTVKEMPHICNVDMKFTPIHTFRPELQDNGYNGSKSEVSRYGNQQYIELTNGITNNYNNAISLADAQKSSK